MAALWLAVAALLPMRAAAQCDPDLTLSPPETNISPTFGFSVAAYADRVLVASPGISPGSSGSVYRYNASTGGLARTFQGIPFDALQIFGAAVALTSDGNALVSQMNLTTTSPRTSDGTVYLFNSTTGSVLRTFKHPSPSSDDRFGASIDADGSRLLVGAWASRSAFLFNHTTGALIRSYTDPSADAVGEFGNGLAMTGDWIAIGDAGDDLTSPSAGTVYLYTLTSTAPVRELHNPAPPSDPMNTGMDFFGRSISIYGDRVLVGSRDDLSSGGDAAFAHLFDANTGAELRAFNAPDREGNLAEGTVVALSAERAVVASNRLNQVFIFDPDTGELLQTIALSPRTPTFALQIALAEPRLVIGAPNLGDVGQAFVYDCSPNPVREYLLGRASDPTGLDLNSDEEIDIADLLLEL